MHTRLIQKSGKYTPSRKMCILNFYERKLPFSTLKEQKRCQQGLIFGTGKIRLWFTLIQANEILGVAQISLDQVEHVDTAELADRKNIPDRVSVNQRLEEIENKINEIVNVGNLECFV